MQKNEANNDRPVETGRLEIADTFQDAGTRPIEESPDFIVSNPQNAEDINAVKDISQDQNKINSVPPLD